MFGTLSFFAFSEFGYVTNFFFVFLEKHKKMFGLVGFLLQSPEHLLNNTDLFEGYCCQNYSRVTNTDLYLSYVFLGHNDSVQ